MLVGGEWRAARLAHLRALRVVEPIALLTARWAQQAESPRSSTTAVRGGVGSVGSASLGLVIGLSCSEVVAPRLELGSDAVHPSVVHRVHDVGSSSSANERSIACGEAIMALPPWTKPCSRSAERRGGRSCGSPVPRRSGPRTRDRFLLPIMSLNGARHDRRTHKAIGYVSLDEAAVGVTTTLVSVNSGVRSALMSPANSSCLPSLLLVPSDGAVEVDAGHGRTTLGPAVRPSRKTYRRSGSSRIESRNALTRAESRPSGPRPVSRSALRCGRVGSRGVRPRCCVPGRGSCRAGSRREPGG